MDDLNQQMSSDLEDDQGTEKEDQDQNLEEEGHSQMSKTEDSSPMQEDGKHCNSRLAQLPHTRIRNMMKLDTDLHIASQDSVFIVTKAAELFIQYFAREAHKKSVQSKRKTIQKRDLDSVINEVDSMSFLEERPNFDAYYYISEVCFLIPSFIVNVTKLEIGLYTSAERIS